jgi:hypothetical protein
VDWSFLPLLSHYRPHKATRPFYIKDGVSLLAHVCRRPGLTQIYRLYPMGEMNTISCYPHGTLILMLRACPAPSITLVSVGDEIRKFVHHMRGKTQSFRYLRSNPRGPKWLDLLSALNDPSSFIASLPGIRIPS